MKTCKPHLSTRPLAVAASAFALVAVLAAGPALAQKKGGPSPILPGGNSRAPVSVDAAKLEYFDKEQKLVYSGGVVAKQGEATLRASTLVVLLSKEEAPAEGAAPAAGAEGSQIRRIEAAGPVTITSADQVGTGERGVYDRGENKVYLIGNVVLSQGPNITKGDRDSRLIYDLTSGQAQVVGGRVSSIFTPGSSDDRKRPAGR
ncbi:MAG: Organic solvent tolerance protein OstA [Hyphomicrobiales bacterium]|jgi:lipopolysaccharide export system protein LptA|nr:Organic solvent tolerance protein OstA [Hyphomicrobiales bacterium]